MEQCPGLEYLFISVGGGGLVAGVAAVIKHVKPEVIIVGCQPENSPVMMKVNQDILNKLFKNLFRV